MTNTDKQIAFERAISLMHEAQEQLCDAEKLFKKCGIEICPVFRWENFVERLPSFTHGQIGRGIKKFEELSGIPGYFGDDALTEKEDKSRRYVEYSGLRFVQVGEAKTQTQYKYR